jgi:hypothetical protein
MRRLSVFASLAIAALPLAACVAPSEPPPRPAPPVPTPTPTPPPPPPPPPASADWRDWPLTPGTWTYSRNARGNAAQFGASGMPPELLLQCEGARGRIQIARRGATSANVNVRTTSVARTLSLQPTPAAPGYVSTELGARDGLLDAMGFSRGRFVIEGGGLPTLVVPAWAEVLRVVEDCR